MITLHRSFFVLMTAAFFAPLVGMHRPTGNSNNQPERGLTQQEREELELAQA